MLVCHAGDAGSIPVGPACQTCEEVREMLQQWVNKQGHDRCWYYPELFTALAERLDVRLAISPSLPPRCEFEDGCRRYQDQQYG